MPHPSELDCDLQILNGGDPCAPVIATIDFSLFSSGPTLGSVLAADALDHCVMRADPVTALAGATGFTPLPALARGYASALARLGRKVSLIAGYCSGGPLATHIQTALTDAGQPAPDLALVTPTWPTNADVEAEFAQLCAGQDAAARPGPATFTDGNPATVLEHMDAVLRAGLRAASDSQGWDDVEREVIIGQLVPRYHAWLAFLLASAHAGPAEPRGRVCILSGRSGPGPLPATLARAETTVAPVDDAAILSWDALTDALHSLAGS
jgi:hypothetical protein